MKPSQDPSVGRIVRFVGGDVILPAIVTQCAMIPEPLPQEGELTEEEKVAHEKNLLDYNNGTINAQVFLNRDGQYFAEQVDYDEARTHNTWHWPDMPGTPQKAN